jgi:hypothetical protein
MLGHHAIGERVLELLEGIDLERPPADEEVVASGLQAYVQALGLPKPNVRIAPDVRALRISRVYPAQDRGAWQAFTGRQWRLLDEGVSAGWRWGPSGWRAFSPHMEEPRVALDRLVRSDRTALDVGLGSSRYVRGVRHMTQSLDRIARVLTSMVRPPKRVDALVPLAEAAAAGLFAYAVGMRCTGDLVALLRPRMRFDEEGRLHHWDGLPAAEWPNGNGLYFWHGVGMTESAGRDPNAVTPARIAGWANAERRRVAMARIGVEPFMAALRGSVVQQDDFGRLWKTEREIDGEPVVAVEVVNSTLEPDGSYRRYFLRVPPSTRTARRGVAWSFGLTRHTYAPVAQS